MRIEIGKSKRKEKNLTQRHRVRREEEPESPPSQNWEKALA
jgi:hypothetical protein